MSYRFFVIPVRDDGTAAAELNGFLGSRRVLTVDRRWVDQGSESFWSFCVDYLESSGGPVVAGKNGGGRAKVDYREVLSPEDFAWPELSGGGGCRPGLNRSLSGPGIADAGQIVPNAARCW